MGSTHNYVPVRTTRKFQDAQHDERFLGWLQMEEAAMPLIFQVKDVPGLSEKMYTKASVPIVEQSLLDRFASAADLWITEESTDSVMRYTYYLGEVFRREFEGSWVALPGKGKGISASTPVIDLPFRETFVNPLSLINFAVGRRTGDQIGHVLHWAEEDYNKWVSEGRPERTFEGTLRESDG